MVLASFLQCFFKIISTFVKLVTVVTPYKDTHFKPFDNEKKQLICNLITI